MQANNPQQCIANLLTIGEYGKSVDLSAEARLMPTVNQMFDHAQGDVRLAASIALGKCLVGNPSAFLDKLFALVEQANEKKYLFLNTMREIIIENPRCLELHLAGVTDLLMSHSTQDDENIRNIVAESLGRLTPYYEEDFVDTLQTALANSEPKQKATIAKSMKYSGPHIKEKLSL